MKTYVAYLAIALACMALACTIALSACGLKNPLPEQITLQDKATVGITTTMPPEIAKLIGRTHAKRTAAGNNFTSSSHSGNDISAYLYVDYTTKASSTRQMFFQDSDSTASVSISVDPGYITLQISYEENGAVLYQTEKKTINVQPRTIYKIKWSMQRVGQGSRLDNDISWDGSTAYPDTIGVDPSQQYIVFGNDSADIPTIATVGGTNVPFLGSEIWTTEKNVAVIQSVTVRHSGLSDKGIVRNIRIFANGSQVGPTLAHFTEGTESAEYVEIPNIQYQLEPNAYVRLTIQADITDDPKYVGQTLSLSLWTASVTGASVSTFTPLIEGPTVTITNKDNN